MSRVAKVQFNQIELKPFYAHKSKHLHFAVKILFTAGSGCDIPPKIAELLFGSAGEINFIPVREQLLETL